MKQRLKKMSKSKVISLGIVTGIIVAILLVLILIGLTSLIDTDGIGNNRNTNITTKNKSIEVYAPIEFTEGDSDELSSKNDVNISDDSENDNPEVFKSENPSSSEILTNSLPVGTETFHGSLEGFSTIDIPSWYENTRMSYMDYRSITDITTDQYEMQYKYAYTDSETGIRMIGNRYCVVLGQSYSKNIGQYIDIVLDNGEIIPCVLSDTFNDIHTLDGNGCIGIDGGIIEFIVDINSLPEIVKVYGSNEWQFCNEWKFYKWKSPVNQIIKYQKNVLNE